MHATAATTAPRTVQATRYVEPLREGGSVPALVEADDDGLYVVKLRGAAQGLKALVAELLAGELARALGLPVPELVLVDLDPALARAEPDPEIQAPLAASGGLNVGLDFLPGALPYAPGSSAIAGQGLAADIVWFDALVTNVDRTVRNPNLLAWHDRLWLIDHGAALYRQHDATWPAGAAARPFPQIADHVLLPVAGSILDADERLATLLDEATLRAVVDLVPEGWADRDPFVTFLGERLAAPRAFATEAEEARARLA